MLSNVATIRRDSVPTNANHANIQPVYEIYANVQSRDLGSVSNSIYGIVTDLRKQLSPGNSIEVTGQIPSMEGAFDNMSIGLLFAAVFVYMLMVLNYQNFGDPFRRYSGVAGDILRHPDHAVCHGHDAQRAFTDGRDHGDWRRLRKFDFARHLRA